MQEKVLSIPWPDENGVERLIPICRRDFSSYTDAALAPKLTPVSPLGSQLSDLLEGMTPDLLRRAADIMEEQPQTSGADALEAARREAEEAARQISPAPAGPPMTMERANELSWANWLQRSSPGLSFERAQQIAAVRTRTASPVFTDAHLSIALDFMRKNPGASWERCEQFALTGK